MRRAFVGNIPATRRSPRMSKLAIAVAVVGLAACETDPLNGTTISSSVTGTSVLFQGYVDTPNEYVSVQVLSTPTADPTNDANWIEITHTYSNTSPVTCCGSPASPLYSWTVNGVPQPSGTSRWQPGGLLKTRAVSTNPSSGSKRTLTTFDAATYGACFGNELSEGKTWDQIGQDCQGVNNSVAALVSTSRTPEDLPSDQKPDWLGLKLDISAVETGNYYNTWNAPNTLAAFKTTYGFVTATDPTATYYTDGDLGIGREMHCHKASNGEIACYVSNYSASPTTVEFNDDPNAALTNAQGGLPNAFATVAMVWTPNATTNAVKFVAYGSDPNHSRVTNARLDTLGAHTSIPNNCLECHGIDATYNTSSHTVDASARFLPFDPYSYKYNNTFTLPAQQEQFRKLNQLVSQTTQTPTEQDFMAGLYAPDTVNTAGALANDTFVPSGWQSTNNQALQSTYLGFVKVGCRTCHMSAIAPSWDFRESTDWNQGMVNEIRGKICAPAVPGQHSHNMPQSERTTLKLWQSGARAYLVTGWPASPADNHDACVP